YRLYEAMGEKATYYRMLFGDLPDSHAFHFYLGFAEPLGVSVKNLTELREALDKIDERSLKFHIARGDLGKWVDEVLGCRALAQELMMVRHFPEGWKERVIKAVEGAITAAKTALFGGEAHEVGKV
ncbi:MAG: hypothetical protein KIH01_09175, partial [Candidatus Freyarchaeota archaeon]|nr:hypothetical protein [Candidatus Jordarchaeia archaeon]